jgi:hypothetical protein
LPCLYLKIVCDHSWSLNPSQISKFDATNIIKLVFEICSQLVIYLQCGIVQLFFTTIHVIINVCKNYVFLFITLAECMYLLMVILKCKKKTIYPSRWYQGYVWNNLSIFQSQEYLGAFDSMQFYKNNKFNKPSICLIYICLQMRYYLVKKHIVIIGSKVKLIWIAFFVSRWHHFEEFPISRK